MAIIEATLSIRTFDYKMIVNAKIVERFCKVFIDNRTDGSFVLSFLVNEWKIDWKNKKESYDLQIADRTSLLYKNGKINKKTIFFQLDIQKISNK